MIFRPQKNTRPHIVHNIEARYFFQKWKVPHDENDLEERLRSDTSEFVLTL